MGLILRVLGAVDFLALTLILMSPWLPIEVVRFGAYWLIIKGGLFLLISKDLASFFDVLAGFYIIMLTVGLGVDFLTISALIFLGLKAGQSIFF